MKNVHKGIDFSDVLMPMEERLSKAAACTVVLEERGEDLGGLGLSRGFIQMLLDIGHGRLLPEVAAKFSGKLTLVTKLAGLSHRRQRQLLNGTTVDVLTSDGTVKNTTADRLTAGEARQVFDGRKIRSIEEQRKAVAL